MTPEDDIAELTAWANRIDESIFARSPAGLAAAESAEKRSLLLRRVARRLKRVSALEAEIRFWKNELRDLIDAEGLEDHPKLADS